MNGAYSSLLKIGEGAGISGDTGHGASKKSLKSDVWPRGKICAVTSIPQTFSAFYVHFMSYITFARSVIMNTEKS